MDALHTLKTRRSVRSYQPDPVPPEVVDDIVDCGRLAATGRNVQPWEFVVVTAASTRQRLAELIENGRHIAAAPVCVVVFCKETKYFLEDGSAAIQNILVAARAHGLGGCWVAGDKKPYAPQVAQMLGVPAGFKLIGLVALGYAAEEPGLPPKRPLFEVLHRETF
ncbi:nitroreductase family protein [bacterium]|nr:nitroreductase family protein [bacterium]